MITRDINRESFRDFIVIVFYRKLRDDPNSGVHPYPPRKSSPSLLKIIYAPISRGQNQVPVRLTR